jgi:hypothetical protein
MPILGLSSGKAINLSKKQYEALMTQRTPIVGDIMLTIYDEDKKMVGKVKSSCIELLFPDDSLFVSDKVPFNTMKIKDK